jgi:hypothetical protein
MDNWMELLAASNFEALQDDDGSWYVNQYFEVAPGDLRRETLFAGLTGAKARNIVKDLLGMAKKVSSWPGR